MAKICPSCGLIALDSTVNCEKCRHEWPALKADLPVPQCLNSMWICPACHSINDSRAIRCDCGYALRLTPPDSGAAQASDPKRDQPPPVPSQTSAVKLKAGKKKSGISLFWMVAIPLSILVVGWFCVYSAGLLLACVGLMLLKASKNS
jgi:hypothetical protein